MINEKIGGGIETIDLSNSLLNGWTVVSGKFLTMTVSGNVVQINGLVSAPSTTEQMMYTIPARLRPANNCSLLIADSTDSKAVAVNIGADGRVTIGNDVAFNVWYTPNHIYRICVTYIKG